MSKPYPYHILVVSPESSLIKVIEGILADRQITPIQANTATEAVTVIKSHRTLFSLVIVEQELSDIPGVKFLEQVKELCVGALRILVTKKVEKDLLLHAVNHRLVHKYIGDPSDIGELTAAIKSGIRRFNRFREDEDLFGLVKAQNHRLYELSCQQMELTQSRTREIAKLNVQLKTMRNRLTHSNSRHPDKLERLVDTMVAFVKSDPDPQKCINSLFLGTFAYLNEEFSSLEAASGSSHEQE